MIIHAIIQNSFKVLDLFRRKVDEAFMTLNNFYDLNPNFVKETFYYSPNLTHRKYNLYVHSQNIA